MKAWYVYKITFGDGAFYIGYRGTRKPALNDLLVKYFTSSKLVKQRIIDGDMPVGEILATFTDQQTASEYEQQMIYELFDDHNILNQSCYFGRSGFGLLNDDARKKISNRSKELWSDPTYRDKMVEKRKSSWTDERKLEQSNRLTGVKRPQHSDFMKSQPVNQAFVEYSKGERSDEHKQAISAALSGKPKSEEHKQNLKKPKPLTVCRICDKRLMAMGNFMNWCKQQDSITRSDEVLI